MRIYFFRTPKPRRFVHKPIYWDPEADERKEREERVRKELGLPPEDGKFHTSIKRGTFRTLREGGDVKDPAEARRERRNANVRLLIIIGALLVAAYLLYVTSGDFLSL